MGEPYDPDKKCKQLYPFMPSDTFRMLICGNSGSGKTNLVYHMLIKPLLYYDEIYLYARNLEQDKYKRLIQKMRELSMKLGLRYEILHVSNDEITPVTEMDYEDNQKVVVFDDYVCDKNQRQRTFNQLKADVKSLVSYEEVKENFIGLKEAEAMQTYLDMGDNFIYRVKTPTANDQASNKSYVDQTATNTINAAALIHATKSELADYLKKDGSTPMIGNLDLNNNRIFHLPAPTGPKQPTPLAFTDFKYLHVAGTNKMLNNLNMDNKSINNLRPPTAPTNAAT